MQLYSLLSIVSMQGILGSALTLPSNHVKRGAETNATLYAYGTNSSAWPIAYGLTDGLLYITQTPDDTSANLTPVSWDLPAITQENWIVNATLLNGTGAGSLAIISEQDNAVGVLPTSQVTASNNTHIGFALFATQLVYNNNTNLEAQFWAQETDTDGIYSLVWVTDADVVETGSFPVVVKGTEN